MPELDANGFVRLDTAARDIADCRLCDADGNRNGFPCDHIDHAAAAKRGKALCLEALRKDRP